MTNLNYLIFLSCLSCLSMAKVAQAAAFNPIALPFLAVGSITQCRVIWSNFLDRKFAKDLDRDIVELNELLGQYLYRKNDFLIVSDTTIIGFIDRKFVLESGPRKSLEYSPSKNLIYPVFRADREDGLTQIMRTLNEVDEEHSWVYVPSKNLWVDSTLAIAQRSVYSDPVLHSALHNRYGRIELYHTHPEKIILEVKIERNFPMSHLASGAAPTVGDLLNLIKFAWNENRSIPFSTGIIHPMGVSYVAPTEHLLRSSGGPPIADVGNTFYNLTFDDPDHESQIRTLLNLQSIENSMFGSKDGPKLPAFSMAYFSPSEFSMIDEWITTHSAALSVAEAQQIQNKNH